MSRSVVVDLDRWDVVSHDDEEVILRNRSTGVHVRIGKVTEAPKMALPRHG